MTPAEELFDAAGKLDALIMNTTYGPWYVGSHLDPLTPPRTWHLEGVERWRGHTNDVSLGEDEGTARYMATMDPLVGSALAEWLRREARHAEVLEQMLPAFAGATSPALTIARLINGNTTTDQGAVAPPTSTPGGD